jgi:flagellar motor switch protein FliM
VGIEVRTGNASGMRNLAMPAIIIKLMRKKFDGAVVGAQSRVERSGAGMHAPFLGDAKVEIDSRLEGAGLSVEEFLGMVEGELPVFAPPLHRPLDGIVNSKPNSWGKSSASPTTKPFLSPTRPRGI